MFIGNLYSTRDNEFNENLILILYPKYIHVELTLDTRSRTHILKKNACAIENLKFARQNQEKITLPQILIPNNLILIWVTTTYLYIEKH